MSKALIICRKSISSNSNDLSKLKSVEEGIIPNNIKPNKALLTNNGETISCVFNPVSEKQLHDNSMLLGVCSESNWWRLDDEFKVYDGSYAIFRENQHKIELLTDSVASRTIWYYKDKEVFAASNSQLAIIYFLKKFEFNKDVIPWMLSTGSLGPFLSWDKRIQALKPQSKLIFDKKKWAYTVQEQKIKFGDGANKNVPLKNFESELESRIDSSIQSLSIDDKITLPLSGGYDSRSILLSLNKKKIKVTTITWGSEEALNNKKSDAYIAQKLAQKLGYDHSYLLSNNPELDIRTVIDRFLINSEGRIDHIAGYMDGFEIWKDLFDKEYSTILRGDEGFGWMPVTNEKQARISCALVTLDDYGGMGKLNYKQEIPEDLKRYEDESIEKWRDRLYHSFRLPIILAALNETKSAYIEIINPLLSHSILEYVRSLPDHLRTDKKLFKKIVEKGEREIPFASINANISHKDQLRRKEIVDYFIETINENKELELFDSDFLTNLFNKTQSNNMDTKSISNTVKKFIPSFVKVWLKSKSKSLNTIDTYVLLFRVFIIFEMYRKINHHINNHS